MNYKEALKELDELDEELLFEMANVSGKAVKLTNLDFSFYLSKKNSTHGIGVKICWNRERIIDKYLCELELFGDYKYHHNKKVKPHPSVKELKIARDFFKKYKVLMSAVWEDKVADTVVAAYFSKYIELPNLIEEFYDFDSLNEKTKGKLSKCTDVHDLESIVREFDLFPMND